MVTRPKTAEQRQFDRWSHAVEAWNGLSRDDRAERARQCRRTGHQWIATPVGPFCRRCAKYQRDVV